MKRTFYLSFVSLLASSFAFLTPILSPMAALGDRLFTFGLSLLDHILPMPALAMNVGHPLRPTREVTYLTDGLHRLAQPISMRLGDPDEEDDEDGEELDNGLAHGAGSHRLNC